MAKFVNKYEAYKMREGTTNTKPSKTDKSQAEDTNIYKSLEKYGMQSLINQTMAKEPMYLDMTNEMSLADAVRMRDEMDEYFEQCPAKVRKTFGDNSEIFYQKYKAGEFTQFLETGVLTNEQVEKLQELNSRPNNTNTTNNKINNTNIQNAETSIQQTE